MWNQWNQGRKPKLKLRWRDECHDRVLKLQAEDLPTITEWQRCLEIALARAKQAPLPVPVLPPLGSLLTPPPAHGASYLHKVTYPTRPASSQVKSRQRKETALHIVIDIRYL